MPSTLDDVAEDSADADLKGSDGLDEKGFSELASDIGPPVKAEGASKRNGTSNRTKTKDRLDTGTSDQADQTAKARPAKKKTIKSEPGKPSSSGGTSRPRGTKRILHCPDPTCPKHGFPNDCNHETLSAALAAMMAANAEASVTSVHEAQSSLQGTATASIATLQAAPSVHEAPTVLTVRSFSDVGTIWQDTSDRCTVRASLTSASGAGQSLHGEMLFEGISKEARRDHQEHA
ncbi:hypothetical protein HDU96_002653 [Phlyctochytrium bullatum]|nr:hypothetical protein HDU96_002653 [Phlyctochytrium bullatum]